MIVLTEAYPPRGLSPQMSTENGGGASAPTPRRRRPTLWDVTAPQYGVPMPPPGQTSAPAGPETPSGAAAQNSFNGAAPPATRDNRAPAVVGPPRFNSIGPLAGIDIGALRALLSPGNPAMGNSAGAALGVPPGSSPAVGSGAGLGGVGALGSSDAPLGSTQHATRHARRLYVGNLPVNATDVEVGDFFNRALAYSKGVVGEGKPVLSVYLNLEKRFAFIELRSLPETAAALAMDGVLFNTMSLRMRRPNDYNEAICPPATPPPSFDPSLLGIVSTQVGDGPNKVFIGGIPYTLTEDEVKQILVAYGRLAAFNLIKDPSTGTSKGFAFFEYADPSVVDSACQNLNGTVLLNKTLTVRRATQHGQRTALGSGIAVGADPGRGGGVDVATLVRQVTRIVELQNVVTEQELADDEEYQDVVEDTEEEARKFGTLQKVTVPRPNPSDGDEQAKGVGRVYLVFEKAADAEKAFAAMNGREFDGRTVSASYIGEESLTENGGHV